MDSSLAEILTISTKMDFMMSTLNHRRIMSYLLKALIAKLRGEVEVAKANIQVYLHNSAGIGEHSDIVEAMEVQIEKIANAEEKIETIEKHFSK